MLWKSVVWLTFVWLVVTGVHFWWLTHWHRPPSWDQAHHLIKGLEYADALRNGQFFDELWNVPESYPPAYHWAIAATSFVIGRTSDLGLWTNSAFLALLILATWQISARLYDTRVALVAATIVTLLPGIAVYSREALIEMPLAAVTATAVWFLVASDAFACRRWSIAAGMAVGIGLLFKQSFVFYLAAPVALSTLQCIKRRTHGGLANLTIFALCAASIAAIWHFPHLQDSIGLLSANHSVAEIFETPRGRLQSVWFYVKTFPLAIASIPTTIVALVGLSRDVHLRRSAVWVSAALITGTIGSLALANVTYDDKYAIPALPAIAILCASAVVHSSAFRNIAVAALMVFQFIQFLVVCLGTSDTTARFHISWLMVGTSDPYNGRNGSGNWGQEQLVSGLPQIAKNVGVIPNEIWFNENNLALSSLQQGRRLTFSPLVQSNSIASPDNSELYRFSHIILKIGPQKIADNTNDLLTIKKSDALSFWVRSHPAQFLRVLAIPVPDGVVELWEVRWPPPTMRVDTTKLDLGISVNRDPATFGDLFQLVGMSWDSTDSGHLLRLRWSSLSPQVVDVRVCVHFLNNQANMIGGADFDPIARHRHVERGDTWTDVVRLPSTIPSSSSRVALCLYHETQGRLTIERGPSNVDNDRLVFDLPKSIPVQR